MANAYSDGVRYGYIEFVDHIPANKKEKPKVLALVGEYSIELPDIDGLKAKDVLDVFTVDEIGFNIERAVIEANGEEDEALMLSMKEDEQTLFEYNPQLIEVDRAVAVLKMAVIGTGWSIDHYYREFGEDGDPKVVVVTFLKPLDITDEGKVIWSNAKFTFPVPDKANFIQIVDFFGEKIREMTNIVGKDRECVRNAWKQLDTCIKRAH